MSENEYKMSHTGEELDEAIENVLNGNYPPSEGGGGDSVFIVNAIGELRIDIENLIVAPNRIISIDKTVAEIIQAAQAGKLVYMSLDVSNSWNQTFVDETTLKLWLPITASNSSYDVVFGGLYDLASVGLPLVIRIMGDLATDEWEVGIIPVSPLDLNG